MPGLLTLWTNYGHYEVTEPLKSVGSPGLEYKPSPAVGCGIRTSNNSSY